MTMRSPDTLISLLSFIHDFGRNLACRHEQFTEVPGQRCLVSNMTFVHNGLDNRQMCITNCIRRHNCQLINYNTYESRCVLSLEACAKLISDERYNIIFVGRLLTAEQCLRWVPITEHTVSRMVSSDHCEYSRTFPGKECYVGRIKSPPYIIPGKFIPRRGNIVYSVLNGSTYMDGTKEILEVSPPCLVTWVPYSAGNVLPKQAVVGVYLKNEKGFRLYVIKGTARRKTVIGYYDTAENRGYVEFRGVNEFTQMEMLVLV